MAGRGSRGSSQSARGQGRGSAAVSSEQTPSPSPTTSIPAGTSHMAPTVPPATAAPSPQPALTDAERVDATPQPHVESLHASQPDPPARQKEKIPITWDGQKGFDLDNNECTQAISDTIELMLNKPWINYSEIPEDVKRRWFDKWAGFSWPEEEKKEIKKSYGYRAARRYQQIMRDLREGELQRLQWMNERLRKMLLDRFANDPGFKKRQASSKKNRASSKGGCLHIGGSATILKTRRRRTEFSANLEEATQQAQEEGDDESTATVDPDIVWRQTLSEPYKNRVYGAGGFFASSLRRSGYAGSSASASSGHTGPPAPEVVDLREQSQGDLLQQQIDEVKSLKSTLAEKDARAEEHLRRMEEMSRMMAAYYGPLRPGSSGGSAAGIDSTTAPPLPPRPPPPPPPSHPPEGDDDDDYDDA
ncbi:hypothetical protein PIB30_030085 [Stylosanthes scabra]|uniref:Uncharacterized protein n=1 Tax=Stylosanthes scabra TaxID=79078 RepID=A0ABU6WBQ6_9FABA|nr:hypothetical protein [Stylosanthes scabra]